MDVVLKLNMCKLFFASITFPTILIGFLVNSFEPSLPVLITRTFRYGKFASKEESGLAKKLEIPKSYFRHFYVINALIYVTVLCEVVSVYIFDQDVRNWYKTLLNFSCGYDRVTTVPMLQVCVAVVLITLQVLRRFYDTHFVSVFSDQARMSLAHYLLGMMYYPAVMLIILSEAPKFSNSSLTSPLKSTIQTYNFGITEVIAIILFLWAWYHQHVTTVILANTRKNKKGDIIDHGYKIPQGDWFNYLSAPHQTAEIIMYTALTLLLFNNSGWFYVCIWVLANQVETILLSHWWYRSNFQNFPRYRKALIPFIY